MNGSAIIDVEGLTKRYGERTVVDNLSMQVQRGEIYGFLGPNGSGKTTSIRMMCGLLTPDGGSGRTLGHDIVQDAAAIKAQVGYMTQRFGLYEDLSLRENLEFVARIYGMDRIGHRVSQTLERLGLTQRQHQLAGSLSGGWKQRLALAACMLHQPRLLLLDEPSLGLAPLVIRTIFRTIVALNREHGLTILLVEQNARQALKIAHRGYVLQNGRIVLEGSGAALLTDPQVRAAYLDAVS